MATIIDYLDWRGDLSFEKSPLNEVDGYILCKVGCPEYKGIIPQTGAVSLNGAVKAFCSTVGEDEAEEALGPLASEFIMPVITKLPQTERFGKLIAADYESEIDLVEEEQFSALTIILPDGARFVTFRGTGDAIVSWKEDFLLCVHDAVPAQRDALKYLIKQASYNDAKLIVGGHSKGGNMAVYAAMNAPEEIQRRIIAVYDYDGPGFRQSPYQSAGFLRIKPVLHKYVSQHTVIGKLLEHEDDCNIVHSYDFAVGAHDGFTWEVLGTQFVRCEDYSASSKSFEAAFNNTLDGMGDEARRDFVEEFFAVLTSTGADTVSDFTEHRIRQALELGQGMYKSPEVKDFLQSVLSIFWQETKNNAKQSAKAAIPRYRLPFGLGDRDKNDRGEK